MAVPGQVVVSELRKSFKAVEAVRGVSFEVAQGAVFGLLGPNGAGKSTTVRMLCTLLEPSSGTAVIAGHDVTKAPAEVRANLGVVLAGDRSLYWKLTGAENLAYFAALYGLPRQLAEARIKAALEMFDLGAKANERVETYSTGMKQRLSLARALLHNPPVVLLDEPTAGLDPQSARRLRELLVLLSEQGRTVLLTTHYMEEADQLCDEIAIMDHGRIIAQDSPKGLKARLREQHVCHLEVDAPATLGSDELRAALAVGGQAVVAELGAGRWKASLQGPELRERLPQVFARLQEGGWGLRSLQVVEPTLEDVFIHLTGKALRD